MLTRQTHSDAKRCLNAIKQRLGEPSACFYDWLEFQIELTLRAENETTLRPKYTAAEIEGLPGCRIKHYITQVLCVTAATFLNRQPGKAVCMGWTRI